MKAITNSKDQEHMNMRWEKKMTGNIRNRVLAFTLILLMVFLALTPSGFAETFTVKNGNCSIKITEIKSIDDIMTISYEFKNNGSSTANFNTSFASNAFQEGVECSRTYFSTYNKNLSTDIKDGAKIDTVEAYNLFDKESIVEIKIGTWLFMLDSITLYFNPVTQNWGNSKDKVSRNESTLTAKIPDTIIGSANKTKNDESWICENCGSEQTSNFCPNCGNPKPSPDLTTENVVRLSCVVQHKGKGISGFYTGEVMGGIPQGYGFFESDEWTHAGMWSNGVPAEEIGTNGEQQEGNYKPGQVITFGQYQQSESFWNKVSPIEWIILDISGDQALIVSKNALDITPMENDGNKEWNSSNIRAWANDVFLRKAFSEKEKKMIISGSDLNTELSDDISDPVFLLSKEEVTLYFSGQKDLICQVSQFAKTKGAFVNTGDKGRWLLRSSSMFDFYLVDEEGQIVGGSYEQCVFRPAIRINLSQLDEQASSDL